MTAHVAFVGLGTMGSGMANRLLQHGFSLMVHNRTRQKAEALLAAGAKWAETPREAAASADAVLVMVADDHASRALWLGHDGLLAGLRPCSLAVECSTLSPAWLGELRQAVESEKGRFLDAPVTGSKPQAAAGELIFMIGGDDATVAAARPFLAPMGKKFVHVGGPGSGARLKLINNFLSGVQAAALAEAVGLMERSGVPPAKAAEVILEGAPGSPMVKNVFNRMQKGDETVYFALHLMAKDLTYAQDEATAHQMSLKTAGAALSIFRSAMNHGDAERDLSAVTRQFRVSPTAAAS